MPFCYSPWTNIDISPAGDVTPCCKFQKKHYKQQFNIKDDSITEYAQSEFLDSIKQEFLNDRWPVGCERCRIEEENQIESKRVLDYTRWQEKYAHYNLSNTDFITASVAFGNTCNLKCITCNPHSSSLWKKEYNDIHGIDIKHFKFYKKDFVQDFILNTPNIIHIDIPGGEPFLSGIAEQKSLLKHYIDTCQSNNITLHYTTNVQVFPDTEWWELWSHFKEIDIQLSIDGVGERYEYIRYPGVWSTLVDHTDQYLKKEKELSNIRLSVSHTVSAYNIFYLDEFFTWCYNVGLPRPWLGRVHTPDYMRPSVWEQPAKSQIINKLISSEHTDVQNWADLLTNTNDDILFKQFRTKVKEHDAYRKLDFKKTFPELAEYI